MGGCLAFKAFETTVTVFSDSGNLESLDRFRLPSLPRVGSNPHDADVTLRIRHEGGDGYEITFDGATERLGDFRALTVEAVSRLVDEAIVARLSDLSAIHAGVVAFGERAVRGRSCSASTAATRFHRWPRRLALAWRARRWRWVGYSRCNTVPMRSGR